MSGWDAYYINLYLQLPNARKSLKFLKVKDISGKDATQADHKIRDGIDYARIGPCALGHQVFYCHDHLPNWMRGIQKRCAHEQNWNQGVRQDFYKFVKKTIIKKLPVLEAGLVFEELMEEWLLNSKYNSKRRQKMRELADALLSNKKDIKKIYHMTSFIKKEFYSELKEPRIINSRSDEFKSLVGPFTHQIEKLVMREHYIKHKLPSDVAQQMNDMATKYPLLYETDYSSFEGSFDRELMEHVELAMMEHVLQNYPWILSIIKRAYSKKNFLRYKVCEGNFASCQFEGSRMSGDMWTSLCNGFTNYCLVSYFAWKAQQDVGYFDYDFIVEGDDGFIATSYPLRFDLAAELGFKLKCEAKHDINDLSFCGICEFNGRLVPDIHTILNKYGYVHTTNIVRGIKNANNSRKQLKRTRDLIHSKALSLLAQSAGIPVLQAVAQQQLKLGGKFVPKYVDWWESEVYDFSQVTQMTSLPIEDGMRKFVETRFEISVKHQLAIEKKLSECNLVCYDIDLRPKANI